jgi:hypothetical protein
MIKEKCPICKKEMDCYKDIMDGHILMEESEVCLEGHYSYEYLQGVTQIRVGEISLWYNYLTPIQEIPRIHILADRLVIRYKRQHPLEAV